MIRTAIMVDGAYLYRVFYYDYPPMSKKMQHPLTKRTIDLSQTDQYKWSNDFFNELKHQRKFALRFGRLAEEQAYYTLRPQSIKRLLNGDLTCDALTEEDFMLSVTQKGVDMRIGVDFILDPMRAKIKDDLFEHIDGMRTKAPKAPIWNKETT